MENSAKIVYCFKYNRNDPLVRNFDIKFAKRQCFWLCWEAILNGQNMLHIRNQTPYLAETYISQLGSSLVNIRNPSYQNCKDAVENSYLELKYLKRQTEKLCLIAIKKDPFALSCIPNQTRAMQIEAIKRSPFALQHIKNPSKEVCQILLDKWIYPKYR